MTDEEAAAKAQAIAATASKVLDGVDGDTAVRILAAFAVGMIAGNMPNTSALIASASVFGEYFNRYASQAIMRQEVEEARK